MVEEASNSANAIIAQALQNAGVPERNIEVPSEVVVESAPIPNPEGGPKGQVMGEEKVEKPTETKLPESPETVPDETAGQPLGKAEIGALIDQASSKFQGIMDKKINQLNFQMQQTIGALNQFFQAQETPDISGLPESEQIAKRLERLEKPSQPRIQIQSAPASDAAVQQLYQYLVDMADVAGLTPDDKRLDWGKDLAVTSAPDIIQRFKVSVKAALLGDQTKAIQELKDNGSKAITKLRKQTGADKVPAGGPSGSGLPDLSKMTAMQKIEYGFQIQEQLSQANQ